MYDELRRARVEKRNTLFEDTRNIYKYYVLTCTIYMTRHDYNQYRLSERHVPRTTSTYLSYRRIGNPLTSVSDGNKTPRRISETCMGLVLCPWGKRTSFLFFLLGLTKSGILFRKVLTFVPYTSSFSIYTRKVTFFVDEPSLSLVYPLFLSLLISTLRKSFFCSLRFTRGFSLLTTEGLKRRTPRPGAPSLLTYQEEVLVPSFRLHLRGSVGSLTLTRGFVKTDSWGAYRSIEVISVSLEPYKRVPRPLHLPTQTQEWVGVTTVFIWSVRLKSEKIRTQISSRGSSTRWTEKCAKRSRIPDHLSLRNEVRVDVAGGTGRLCAIFQDHLPREARHNTERVWSPRIINSTVYDWCPKANVVYVWSFLWTSAHPKGGSERHQDSGAGPATVS